MKLANMVKLGLGAIVVASGLGFGGISGAFGKGTEGIATAAAFKPGDVTYEKDYGITAKSKSPYHKFSLKTRGVVAKDGKTVDLVVRVTSLEKGTVTFRVDANNKKGYYSMDPKSSNFGNSTKIGKYHDFKFKKKTGTYYLDISVRGSHKEVKTTHKGTL